MKHFIARAGQDYGPYSLDDPRKFVAEGYFKVSDGRGRNMWVAAYSAGNLGRHLCENKAVAHEAQG